MDSDQATYLYLLPYPYTTETQHHASGATHASAPLAAGNHAIVVVRDTPRRANGGFTLTVDTDIEEPEPVTVTGLADSHSATVGELFSVGFAYEPAAAVLSVESVTPSGLTFALVDLGGSAGLAGTPSLAGVYTVDLAFTQPGRVDTRSFTVTAECPEGHAELPDRSCEGLAAVCTESLSPGWVSSGTLGPQAGSWDSGCVLPEGRMGRSGTFYAEHYMFRLLFDAVVTIDLTSSTDTYLFLLEGYGAHGDEVDRDNDGGAGSNSRLANLSLAAGGYTVVASTYQRERTGEFEVSLEAYVPLTVSGLVYPPRQLQRHRRGTLQHELQLPAQRRRVLSQADHARGVDPHTGGPGRQCRPGRHARARGNL